MARIVEARIGGDAARRKRKQYSAILA